MCVGWKEDGLHKGQHIEWDLIYTADGRDYTISSPLRTTFESHLKKCDKIPGAGGRGRGGGGGAGSTCSKSHIQRVNKFGRHRTRLKFSDNFDSSTHRSID